MALCYGPSTELWILGMNKVAIIIPCMAAWPIQFGSGSVLVRAPTLRSNNTGLNARAAEELARVGKSHGAGVEQPLGLLLKGSLVAGDGGKELSPRSCRP